MHADEAIRAAGSAGDLGDADRRRVAGEDRVRRADLVQLAEQVVLDGQALEHRLDHQVAVGEVVELRRAVPLRHDLGQLARAASLPRSTLLRRKPSVCAARAVQRVLVQVEHAGPKARARADDGDAGAHGAGAGNADGLDLAHRCLLGFRIQRCRKLRPMSWRWIWLVPSQICVILASRIRRSTRKSLQ